MSSTRLIYDDCANIQRTADSTSLINYFFYKGKFENCTDCNTRRLELNEPTRNGTIPLVDIESELIGGRNRPLTKCDQYKYNPKCNTEGLCLSGSDPRIFVNNPPDVCDYLPLKWNNIKKMTSPGYVLPNTDLCNKN